MGADSEDHTQGRMAKYLEYGLGLLNDLLIISQELERGGSMALGLS